MKTALIGYTGFVGGNILHQKWFDELYNSKNISDIKNRKFDLVVSCGTSSLMWKANIEPEQDWHQVQNLINNLEKVKSSHFILISTIFVYPDPYQVDEDTKIKPLNLTPYGLHRYKLEQFVISKFKSFTIVRLPNLFGQGIKKNFIFDLIYNNRFDLTHKNSKMQWYNLDNIWHDIQIALDNEVKIINFAVEPLETRKIANYTLNINFNTITEKPPLNHNMLTKYGSIYGVKSPYIYTAAETLENLKIFINEQKGAKHE